MSVLVLDTGCGRRLLFLMAVFSGRGARAAAENVGSMGEMVVSDPMGKLVDRGVLTGEMSLPTDSFRGTIVV